MKDEDGSWYIHVPRDKAKAQPDGINDMDELLSVQGGPAS